MGLSEKKIFESGNQSGYLFIKSYDNIYATKILNTNSYFKIKYRYLQF